MYMTLRKLYYRILDSSSVLAKAFSSFPAHLLQHPSTLILIPDFTIHTHTHTHSEKKHKSVKTSLTLILLRNKSTVVQICFTGVNV